MLDGTTLGKEVSGPFCNTFIACNGTATALCNNDTTRGPQNPDTEGGMKARSKQASKHTTLMQDKETEGDAETTRKQREKAKGENKKKDKEEKREAGE